MSKKITRFINWFIAVLFGLTFIMVLFGQVEGDATTAMACLGIMALSIANNHFIEK